MLNDLTLIQMFCDVEDFVVEVKHGLDTRMLTHRTVIRHREPGLSDSELMTILIAFHHSGYRTFKHFYTRHVRRYWIKWFPHLVSYTRFLNLMPRVLVPLCVYLKRRYGTQTGIAFIDSTALAVCHPKRIARNRVFKGIAKRGKTTYGWFFGFKLHLVINDCGELLGVTLTPGNTDDRVPVDDLTALLKGSLFGDKGYISQKLTETLGARALNLVTSVRANMKNKLMPLMDKILLRKRSLIETVNDQLKNIAQITHTRHRSPISFCLNLVAALIAYSYQPKKPSLNISLSDFGVSHDTMLLA